MKDTFSRVIEMRKEIRKKAKLNRLEELFSVEILSGERSAVFSRISTISCIFMS